MAAHWEIAAFIVTLFTILFSVSPPAASIIQQIVRQVICLCFPARGRCRRVLWSDMPPDRLHICDPQSPLCQHRPITPANAQPHNPMNCWEDTIGKVFNTYWALAKNEPLTSSNSVHKPHQLPLSVDFIQTDVQTVKAFIMLTAEICRTCTHANINSMLELKQFGGIATIHLQAAASAPLSAKLTRFELDRMIEGYPPFYRQKFETTGNIELNHPITKTDHVGRGAWVLAVGMSNTTGPIPTMYNMQRVTHEKTGAFWRGTLVMSAFKMIHETLNQLKVFERSQRRRYQLGLLPADAVWADHALDCFQKILDPDYALRQWDLKTQQIEQTYLFESLVGPCDCTFRCIGSSPHSSTCGRGQHARKEPASKLTKKQCLAALEIFNNYNHSTDNLEIIWPVFPEVLQTLILGMCEVEHYFSYIAEKLDLPKELEESRYIYLRNCASDVD